MAAHECYLLLPRRQTLTPLSAFFKDTRRPFLPDENLLYEVLRHVGRRAHFKARRRPTMKRTAHDERLWERSPHETLPPAADAARAPSYWRSQLPPLFEPPRRLRSSLLLLLQPPPFQMWPCLPPDSAPPLCSARYKARWGKDEVNLSLSLLSIKYFEKMSFNNRSK
ncbi:hypothetical protein DH2020_000745 [Rehmannia glutinosa]|uniref:Uncharacterized protein n=1 Tax=Rehmannia glutinosa TaxID=99300 RepID=A0ABR0XXD1_REHGL